jgi:NACalpha-BTF3-like transcription factor
VSDDDDLHPTPADMQFSQRRPLWQISAPLTEQIEQLERYGPCPADIVAVIEALAEFNDDRCHDRDIQIVMVPAKVKIQEAVKALTLR